MEITRNFFLFIASFPLYTLVLLLAWYIPGSFFIRGKNVSAFQRFVLSCGTGMALWGWQGWVFGWLHLRWLTYLYLFVFFVLWGKSVVPPKISRNQFSKMLVKTVRNLDLVLLFVVITGIIIQLQGAWFNGLTVGDEIMFSGGHEPDHIWHAALTGALVRNIPPLEPAMNGIPVVHYHYWGNLIMAEIIRVFHLPLLPVVFQLFAFVQTLMLGLSVIVFSHILGLKKTVTRFFAFFMYFGGDALPFLVMFLGRGFNFGMGSMENGAAFLMNYPRSFAFITTFIGLSLFIMWLRNGSRRITVAFVTVISVIIGMKANVGLFLLFGLGVLGVYYMMKRKGSRIIPLVALVILSLIVFLPANKEAGGLVFTGFWRSRDFIVHPGLGLSHLELARQIFAADGKWVKALCYDLLFLFLFTAGTLGTKLIGLVQSRRSLNTLPFELNLVLISGFIMSFAAGTFFIQVSGGSNSFNFIVNVFLAGSLYTAIAVAFIMEKLPFPVLRLLFILVVIIGTIPRAVHEANFNYQRIYSNKVYRIDKDERDADEFIRKNTRENDVILSGSHITSFLANREIYTSPGNGNSILITHGLDPKDREDTLKVLYESQNSEELYVRLSELGVSILINPQVEPEVIVGSRNFLVPIYANTSYTVYQLTIKTAQLLID